MRRPRRGTRVVVAAAVLVALAAAVVVARLTPASRVAAAGAAPGSRPPAALPDLGALPALATRAGWLGGTAPALAGRVTLVEFWTSTCANCRHTLPHVRAWYDRYRGDGLVVLGIHSPEFAYERDPARVAAAVRDLDVRWPVLLDPDHEAWQRFGNHWWPRTYVVDAAGRIRRDVIGEGGYDATEDAIRALLHVPPDAPRATVSAT